LAGLAADVQEVLAGAPGHARQMLRKLFAGHRIACVPFVEPDGTQGYTFEATGTYAALLAGRRVANDGGVPDGTRPWRTSRTRVSVGTCRRGAQVPSPRQMALRVEKLLNPTTWKAPTVGQTGWYARALAS
jgi:hypothetical protein